MSPMVIDFKGSRLMIIFYQFDCITFLPVTQTVTGKTESVLSYFLGGLSLHLNHLIASHTANYDWPFGTLPFGLFGSNLDTRDLETYPRTYSGHF